MKKQVPSLPPSAPSVPLCALPLPCTCPRARAPAKDVETPNRPHTELDDIFRDADCGGGHISLGGPHSIQQWCGMFVGAHLFRGGGLDEEIRKGMVHVKNVMHYFQYNREGDNRERTPHSIWAEGQWWRPKDYHAVRGTLRRWIPKSTVNEAIQNHQPLDIRPGDVVLIAYNSHESADHITMVESYDPASGHMVTIEGNSSPGGIRANRTGEVERNKQNDEYVNPGPALRSGVALQIRDLDKQGQTTRDPHQDQIAHGSYQNASTSYRWSVHGVGRCSAVDFEEWSYADLEVPRALQHMSPAEMRALAARTGITDKAEERKQQTVKSLSLKPDR